MNIDMIVYFFNCYYLMLDYDESMSQIVAGYIEKEKDVLVKNIYDQMDCVLKAEINTRTYYLNEIISSCEEMDVRTDEMESIIKTVFEEFKKQLRN